MKKYILLAITLCILFANKSFALEFSDIQNSHQNFVAINHLSDIGIIKGYPDGSFAPDKILNRAESLKLIFEAAAIQTTEELTESPFPDVPLDQWFTRYVYQAKYLGIVKGNPDGSFAPDRQVKRVEFIKMLLEANRFRKENWDGQQFYNDVPGDVWFTPYMNYAAKSGLILPDKDNNLLPENPVSRGETAEILYLMRIILKGGDTQYLLEQSELQMAQIDIYIGAKKSLYAKRSADLANDMTQQALKNAPENNIVLGAAKIAKAYQLLVDAYLAGLQDQDDLARSLVEQTKAKATEAWETNNDVQQIAKHIKDRAEEILSQL